MSYANVFLIRLVLPGLHIMAAENAKLVFHAKAAYLIKKDHYMQEEIF
ncbi:MAG: hypothetical protein ACRDBM_12725 [Sporomusa sp.]